MSFSINRLYIGNVFKETDPDFPFDPISLVREILIY